MIFHLDRSVRLDRKSFFNSWKFFQSKEFCKCPQTLNLYIFGLQAKYYYEKFNLRYVAPFVLLLIYSLVGAALFYWVEYENERELLR